MLTLLGYFIFIWMIFRIFPGLDWLRAIHYYILFIITSLIVLLLCFIIIVLNFIVEKIFKKQIKEYLLFLLKYYYAKTYLLILMLCRVNIYLDDYFCNDNKILWISNHRSKLDGTIIQSLLFYNNVNVVSIIKDEIKYIPIIWQINMIFKSIFVKRNKNNTGFISDVKDRIKNNYNIMFFPEGQTMSCVNISSSHNLSQKLNKHKHNYTLLPKINGFNIMKELNHFYIIGNITIAYDEPKLSMNSAHSYFTLFKKFPKKIYIHISYDNIDNFDLEEEFINKDDYLKKFDNEKIPRSNYHLKFNILLK